MNKFFALGFIALLASFTLIAMGGHDYHHALYSPDTAFHPTRARFEIGLGVLAGFFSFLSFVIFWRGRRRARS